MPQVVPVKDEARRLIDALPDDATWEDISRLFFERLMIEEGLRILTLGARGPAMRFAIGWENHWREIEK